LGRESSNTRGAEAKKKGNVFRVAEKRRLPVINSKASPDSDGDEPRPPWHWVGFGVVAIFGAWLPLAYLAETAKRRFVTAMVGAVDSPEQAESAIAGLDPRDRSRLMAAAIGLPAVALALGAFAGGYLVGRWSERAGTREAAIAGALAGVVSGVLALLAGAGPTAFAPLFLAALFAALGGRVGSRRRTKLPPEA
jgi:hypothetical protein